MIIKKEEIFSKRVQNNMKLGCSLELAEIVAKESILREILKHHFESLKIKRRQNEHMGKL